MLPVFIYFFAAVGLSILAILAFRHSSVFLYLFLLGLPFDNVTYTIGVFKISVPDAALVLLTLAWLLDFFLKRQTKVLYPVQVYAALMLIFFIVAANLINAKPPESYYTSFSFSVKIIGFILILQLIRTEKQLTTALKILLVGGILSVFLAMYQQYAFITGGMPKLKMVMAEGTKAGLNTNLPFIPLRVPSGLNREAAYGVYLSFIIIFSISLYFFRFSFRTKAIAFLPLLLFMATLVMNDTRAAYIAVVISMIVAILLSNTRARYLILLVLVFLPLISVPVYTFLFQHRETSLIQRQEIVYTIFDYAFKHPWGGGIFDFVKYSEHNIGAHSSLLQVLTHGGIPAFFAYLVILLSIFFRLISHFKEILQVRLSGSFRYGLYSILTASFAGVILQSEFIHPRAANKDHWAFLALIFLAPLLVDKAKEVEKVYFTENKLITAEKSRLEIVKQT